MPHIKAATTAAVAGAEVGQMVPAKVGVEEGGEMVFKERQVQGGVLLKRQAAVEAEWVKEVAGLEAIEHPTPAAAPLVALGMPAIVGLLLHPVQGMVLVAWELQDQLLQQKRRLTCQ